MPPWRCGLSAAGPAATSRRMRGRRAPLVRALDAYASRMADRDSRAAAECHAIRTARVRAGREVGKGLEADEKSPMPDPRPSFPRAQSENKVCAICARLCAGVLHRDAFFYPELQRYPLTLGQTLDPSN